MFNESDRPIYFQDGERNWHYFRSMPGDLEAAYRKFINLYDSVRVFPIDSVTYPIHEVQARLALIETTAIYNIGQEADSWTLKQIKDFYLTRAKGLQWFIEHKAEILAAQVPVPPRET